MNKAIIRSRLIGVLTLVISCVWMAAAWAQQPVFNIIKPSTTGVPGNEVRVMGFDPAGNLWIGARVTVWGEIALAMLSADQVGHHPLPGGGFDTGAWKVWSSVHGNPFPSIYLNGLAFSSDGTIWVSSEGGLTRFRPNAQPPEEMWHTYTPANSPLVLNEVRSISMDSQGNLWIANASLNFAFSYLFKLNTATDQWTSIPTAGHQPFGLAVGNNDHVLISMKDVGGIMEFNGSSWAHYDALPRELGNLMQDSQGNVWAAGSGINAEGLWKWNGVAWQYWPDVDGDITVTGIGKDRDGVVYVSMWYGAIYKMINDTPVFFAAAEPLPRAVIGRPNGDIYVNNYGSNLGLGRVRHYTASGQLLSRRNIFNAGLPDYFVDRIRRDSSGNMWFASGEGGLSRMLGSNGAPDAATHWRNWGNYNEGSEPYPWAGSWPMYSVFEDENGIFWMIGNGVGRWDSVTGEFTDFWNWQNSNLDSSGIYAIAKREGTMWVGSGGSGVSWLNGNNWTRVSLSGGPYNYSAEHVNAMAADTANNLWVGSDYGLRKFAPGDNASFTFYNTTSSPLPSDYILDVKADPSGGIWIGTAGGGLVRFDGTTWTTYNQGNTGMPGTNVNEIARRPSDGLIAIANVQGNIWPYTGGVSTFNGTTWRHYTPANSPLTHWQVQAVEFDGNGNLWASTMSKGVVQIMIGSPSPSPSPSPTPTPVATPVATATPIATLALSGSISYCSALSPGPVPNVALTLTGSMSSSTLSDGSGNYAFSSLPSGGNYTVTPNKSALPPSSAGIDTVDVIATQRHFLVVGTPLSGCRLTASDVNGVGGIDTIDVIAIQRFFLGLTTGIANVGKYQFNPVNRAYLGLVSNQTGQNFDALVLGDVASGFVHRPEGMSTDEIASTVAVVALPEIAVDQLPTPKGLREQALWRAQSKNSFIAAVKSSKIDAKNKLVGFQGDFTFDERAITFQSQPVQKAGLTGGNWNVSGNVLAGNGPIRTLRISAYSNDFTPLSGSGTLFELRMTRARQAAESTALLWAAPPDQFIFIDADLNTQKPGKAALGSVTTSGKRK